MTIMPVLNLSTGTTGGEVALAALTPTTGSVNLDFGGARLLTHALTGDVTYTTSNLSASRSVTIEVTAAAERTLTFPAWVFVGTEPTVIAAGKTGILTITSFGTSDAECVAAWAVQA